MTQAWSWILAIVGLSGIAMVGAIRREGWLVLILNEILWVAYALRTRQYGFILMAVTYATIYAFSYRKWGRGIED